MRYLPFFLILFLFSCNSKTTSNSGQGVEKAQDMKPTKKCDPSSEPNFKGLIENSARIGKIEGGMPLKIAELKAKGYKFSGVDGENDIIQHIFSPDMRELFIVRETKKDHLVREITLIARDYVTSKCIGVNSSINDFIAAYPDYEIGFDASNDSFYISTPELLGVKFNLLTITYTGDMSEVNPRKKYSKDQFAPDTKIANIHLSDF